MRLLLIDDEAEKLAKLVAVLTSSGVPRADIDMARSAADARDRLRGQKYDLAILDLLLPNHHEETASLQNSLTLLREIHERDEFYKPDRLIGFTAFADAAEIATPDFHEMLWTIVIFDETTNEWQEQVRKLIAYLEGSRSKPQKLGYDTDLCIITALHEPEMEAIHRIPWSWEASEPIDDSTFVRKGRFFSKQKEYRAIAACCPRMGNVAAALLAARLIEACRPRFIAMAGICAGIRQKANLGDAVLFSPSWEWASGKVVAADEVSSRLEPAPHQLAVPDFVLARAEELRKDQQFWLAAKNGFPEPRQLMPKLLIAPGASGPSVVAHENSAEAIRLQHRKLTAIDMEVYGVCAAAASAVAPRPAAFGLKAVCDFADDEKNDAHQAYAAHISACALKEFFERYMADVHSLVGG